MAHDTLPAEGAGNGPGNLVGGEEEAAPRSKIAKYPAIKSIRWCGKDRTAMVPAPAPA